MTLVPCPYLGSDVELTDERLAHIINRHPDLLPAYMEQVVRTITDPDEVRRHSRFPATWVFVRWFDEVRQGKLVVVVIVSDTEQEERHWIVTAYLTRRVRQGVVEWKRN